VIGWLQPRAQRYRFLPESKWGGGALPWVIGMMTFLVALALAGGISMSNATSSMTAALSRTFTVQIVEANPELRREQAETAASLLRGLPGIADVEIVGEAEMRRMLEPWLGEGNVGEDLPLPAMIDASFERGASISSEQVARLVRTAVPKARVDDHAQWFGPLAEVVEVLKWLSIALAVLVAATTASIVALSVRAALSSYRPTIETLHMMGAEDRTISQLFQYRYGIQGLLGGVLGFLSALAVIFVIGGLLGDFGGGLAGDARLTLLGWTALALLPIVVTLLTLVTARVTVERALRAQL
jgi:cell division transport system permease protein